MADNVKQWLRLSKPAFSVYVLSVMKIMLAVEIAAPGKSANLRLVQRPIPTPGPEEILIRVHAAGINRPDILQREGKYQPPPGITDIPGLEVAGTVEEIGDHVTGWHEGQRIMALLAGGGYAEYALAPAPQCLPIPHSWSDAVAASFPETFFTVWTNLFDRGALRAGQSLLIHGGASGIGTAAIQLAHHFGARIFTTAGTRKKCERCRSLGADWAISYREEDFETVIEHETSGQGVDLILDMIGGEYIEKNLRCLAIEGKLIQIAFMQGSRANLNLAPLMVKRQWITGSTLRPRSIAEKGEIARSLREHVWPLLETGKVAPILDRTFPFDKVSQAHDYLESGQHFGKIALITG